MARGGEGRGFIRSFCKNVQLLFAKALHFRAIIVRSWVVGSGTRGVQGGGRGLYKRRSDDSKVPGVQGNEGGAPTSEPSKWRSH